LTPSRCITRSITITITITTIHHHQPSPSPITIGVSHEATPLSHSIIIRFPFRAQPVLAAAGAKPEGEWNGYKGDPFEFLPKWMTKNPLRTK
jgi:hypothetical protein